MNICCSLKRYPVPLDECSNSTREPFVLYASFLVLGLNKNLVLLLVAMLSLLVAMHLLLVSVVRPGASFVAAPFCSRDEELETRTSTQVPPKRDS